MSDPYRRPVAPGAEPPLAFDDRRPPRRGGPAPVTLIVSLLVLAGAAGGVFYLYRGGVRGADQAPQPVGAPLRDVRTPAPPQPQAADPAAGLSIYKDDAQSASTAPPAFVAPPEQPAPRSVTASLPPAPSAAASAAAVPPPVAKPRAEPKIADQAASVDTLIQAAQEERPTPAAPGAAVVQIGAFSSRALADDGWSAAAAAAPGSMAGKGKRVVALNKDGATLYRTSITGFSSREEAEGVCAKLKAAGKSCFVR